MKTRLQFKFHLTRDKQCSVCILSSKYCFFFEYTYLCKIKSPFEVKKLFSGVIFKHLNFGKNQDVINYFTIKYKTSNTMCETNNV